MTEQEVPEFPGVRRFLFEAGLYAEYRISSNQATSLVREYSGIDGHCPFCHQTSLFRNEAEIFKVDHLKEGEEITYRLLRLFCQRNPTHRLSFLTIQSQGLIQKVGQFPSLADITHDEIRYYRKILSPHQGKEFSRAIGLAAHGVGIGSFVYLRRVFERLVNFRFNEFRETEGWSDSDFQPLRMEEKIEFLSRHLPDFLVQNKKVYAILSKGVHELDENQCLSFFPVLKSSILVILEED